MSSTATIVWGLTSSVAIYKAVETIRLLTRDGTVEVVAILSRAAESLIRPLLIESLTQRPVYRARDRMREDHAILHTALARQADLIVIAPATAHVLAKLAHGFADDLLTSTVLAYDGPVLVAPAMNVHMWRHPATQANVRILRERGVVIVGPNEGVQAEGDVGPGRLVEPEELAAAIRLRLQQTRDLAGQTVLVTAGPTREPIDPVRFISNRSSGKMGFAVAEAAYRRGAHVVLVAGPNTLIPHPAMTYHTVETTQEMARVVLQYAPQANWIVKCAAVSDYRPVRTRSRKHKKTDAEWTLRLRPTVDILATLGARKRAHQILIGFAAETHDHERFAVEKLVHKNLDYIVLNPVDRPARGFAVDTNQVTVLARDGCRWESPLLNKWALAEWLWDRWITHERTHGEASSCRTSRP